MNFKHLFFQNEREMRNKKIEDLSSRIKQLQELFVKKEAPIKIPKRRHTFCTLGAISEERELENASKNLIQVGLKPESNSSISFGSASSECSPKRHNWYVPLVSNYL